jgi:hypothetical protein
MTTAVLTEITGLYARYNRLTMLGKRTQAQNSELYLLRQQLHELGLEIP